MKIWLCLIAVLFIHYESCSQREMFVQLPASTVEINNRHFFIQKVTDRREVTNTIGYVRKGAFNTWIRANFAGDLENYLDNYFEQVLPQKEGFLPIEIVINTFEVNETAQYGKEVCLLLIDCDFLIATDTIFNYKEDHQLATGNAEKRHSENIIVGLKDALVQLNTILKAKGYYNGLVLNEDDYIPDSYNSNSERTDYTQDLESVLNPTIENRNVMAIGYQIGGLTLLGFDYEVRVSDYAGVHFGAGLAGFTAGLKIHTNESKNSSFFNLSYKDGGFGLISVMAGEFGGKIRFSRKSDFGLHLQGGIMGILDITEEAKQLIFGSTNGANIPVALLSIGIGFSW